MADVGKKRVLWGALLAWSPWIPVLIGLGMTLGEQKATGVRAVAGGLTELFVAWGIGAILIAQVAAIILLSRAFSAGHVMRNLLSVVSICLSGTLLLLIGLFLWLSWFQAGHS